MSHDPPAARKPKVVREEAGLGEPFTQLVSLTIAMLAMIATGVGGLESVEATGAVTAVSQAALDQDRATDAWGEYQADGLKGRLYGIAGQSAGVNARADAKIAETQAARQAEARMRALAAEAARDRRLAASGVRQRRRDRLTAAAAVLEIAIALCTVAIIARSRGVWKGCLGLAAVSTVLVGLAYLS